MIRFCVPNESTIKAAIFLLSEHYDINNFIRRDNGAAVDAEFLLEYTWTYIVLIDGRFAGIITIIFIGDDLAEIHFVNLPWVSVRLCLRIGRYVLSRFEAKISFVAYHIEKNIERFAKLLGFVELQKGYYYRRKKNG